MSLDRQAIEKRDFPISRRGYETLAVDAHLAQVAREVEALQAARRTPAADTAPVAPSLASSASDQVRAIVQAAERSAAEIEQQASADAERERSAAASAAQAVREAAEAEAQAHVAAVQGTTRGISERLAAVGGVLERLELMVEEIHAGLDALHTEVGVSTPTPGPAVPTPAEPTTPTAIAAASIPSGAAPSPPVVAEPPAAEATPPRQAAPVPAAAHAPEPPASRSTDEAGARMVALSLVLDGVPRDQIERHLDEHYEMSDRDGLLDDLYARQGGA